MRLQTLGPGFWSHGWEVRLRQVPHTHTHSWTLETPQTGLWTPLTCHCSRDLFSPLQHTGQRPGFTETRGSGLSEIQSVWCRELLNSG